MRCYAPDPAGGANSAPPTSWLDFAENKRKKGGKGSEGERKGKEVKRKEGEKEMGEKE